MKIFLQNCENRLYALIPRNRLIALILSWVALAIFVTVLVKKITYIYPVTAYTVILCMVTYVIATTALFIRK